MRQIHQMPQITKLIACCLLLVSLVSSNSILYAQAQEAEDPLVYPIDLSTAMRLAGLNSLKIAAAEAQLGESSGLKISAYERFIPTFWVDWLYKKHTGLTQGTEGEFVEVSKQFHQVGGNIVVSWNWSEALFNVLAARQFHKAKKHFGAGVRDAVLNETAVSYLDLALASALVRNARNAVAVSADLVRQTSGKIEEGIGYESDLLRVKTQLAHDSLALIRSQEEEMLTSARLVNLLSLDEPLRLVPIDTALVALSLVDTTKGIREWLAQAKESRPEIMGQETSLAAFRWEKNQAVWGALLPEVVGEARLSQFGPNLPDLSNSEDYRIGVRWRIGPGGLFDFGRIRSRSARASLAEINRDSVVDAIAEEVTISYASVLSRGRMLSVARTGVDDARRSLDLSTQRRNLGIGLALEVIDAAEALYRAENEHARAIIEYNKAQMDALAAIGQIRTIDISNQ